MLAGALAAFFALPGLAAASEADVVLNFRSGDMPFLYASLAFGVIALIAAFALARGVMSASPGSEKMQEVGQAIKDGALAYLRRQVGTMSIFVALLAVLLFFMYQSQFDTRLGILIAISFVLGVAASYIAGYTGMLLAVNGNMRTAHAALTSYKKSLEVAFRSGAVAGMVTVGMGLIGATLIFLFAREEAMKLLIGFGFGGSLAALFMRVGGGIYTKAADVGADLVGKVEAGIPEDDPRNPATIADNVGDNVGDCAGMAADIFESYEVTLVAAIVLGAATAAIFDSQTWMRLILFALMARGVGIIASILGVYSVRGSDDIDSDPLKAIRKGFYVSAGVALLFTLGVSWWMMGGKDNPIQTSRLTAYEQMDRDVILQIQQIRDEMAVSQSKEKWEIGPMEVMADPKFEAMGFEGQEGIMMLQQALTFDPSTAPAIPKLDGYSKLDAADSANPALSYTIVDQGPTGEIQLKSVKEAYFKDDQPVEMGIYELEVTSPGMPGPDGQLGEPRTEKGVFGPIRRDQIPDAQGEMRVTIVGGKPLNIAHLYVNPEGKLAIGLEGAIKEPQKMRIRTDGYFTEDKAFLENLRQKQMADPMTPSPQPASMAVATVSHKTVPWYMFFAAIAFGVLMAFAIELLTDYYVSTHKKPVKEVAGVSNAGPAPMIIQGFAYALESSVFMVFALVFALIMPLFFFPPAEYGYILSFYGIALVGLGLLTTTGYVLAMDTFGPISDNAQGVYEMSDADSEQGSKAVQRLDAAGNTTKALTKGFAIATAVIAAVALFHSFLAEAKLETLGLRLDLPEIFLGLMIGGAAPFLFSAFSINAVGRAAFQLINEVRRQFRADAGIMLGTSKPDYGRCVAIVTQAAQKELLGPGILAIALPIAVGFGFSIGKVPVEMNGELFNLTGAQALGGFLAGAILSGQLMAVLLANSGGMWDNAKKLIEDGLYGGKGSEAHKAGVVCDTVGDPFKDTAGPALNPLIKVMNLVALLLAPIVIRPFDNKVLALITGVAVLALAFSIYFSKKGSLSSEMQKAAEADEAGEEDRHIAARTLTVEDESSEDVKNEN